MKPENATPGNFTLNRIIYNDPEETFAIAIGTWNDDGSNRFAMRWTGDQENPHDLGYSKVFTHPMWFQMPKDIGPILGALSSNINKGEPKI